MSYIGKIIGMAAVSAGLFSATPALAGPEPYLGEIEMVAFGYCPIGFAEANGASRARSSNSALFSLLGTSFGGNGVSTFNLPDLRSRVPVGVGQGTGLSPYVLGQVGGAENTNLTIANMPAHNHNVQVSSNPATTNNPTGNSFATHAVGVSAYAAGAPNAGAMAPATVSATGSNAPVSRMQPYVGIRYCIATQGLYPSHP